MKIKIRLSLDVDGNSYGADEYFTAAQVAAAGGPDQLISDYVDHYRERIAEIHDISPEAASADHVDITEWS